MSQHTMTFVINKPIWIKPIRAKGIIKSFQNNQVVVTYYQRNDDKRKTKAFDPSMLEEFREKRVEKKPQPNNVGLVTTKVIEIPLTIQIKYFTDIEKIQTLHIGDWIDLRAAEDVSLKEGEFKLIPLGVGMKLPDGHEANMAPRSSTFKNWGIIQTNSPGVIDNAYSGNNDQWRFPAFAIRDVEIKKNDRICQFRIQKIQPKIKFVEVENLDEKDRGGFGSTGTK